MTFKDHGYYGYAYLGARITQAVALLPVIGLVGNFLSLVAKSKHTPPSELVATIVFVCLPFPPSSPSQTSITNLAREKSPSSPSFGSSYP
jgi:hypothetical protein